MHRYLHPGKEAGNGVGLCLAEKKESQRVEGLTCWWMHCFLVMLLGNGRLSRFTFSWCPQSSSTPPKIPWKSYTEIKCQIRWAGAGLLIDDDVVFEYLLYAGRRVGVASMGRKTCLLVSLKKMFSYVINETIIAKTLCKFLILKINTSQIHLLFSLLLYVF